MIRDRIDPADLPSPADALPLSEPTPEQLASVPVTRADFTLPASDEPLPF